MSKHSLISTVAGLGLMAASMGVNAQMAHTFDYSSMYYGVTASGAKYTAFVPTITRGATGSAGVLMLELFQPAASTAASTWAYAVGQAAVGAVAGGEGTNSASGSLVYTLDNGVAATFNYYPGNNVSNSLAFVQPQTISSQACGVSFNAVIGADDQLRFSSVKVQPDNGWTSMTGDATIQISAATNTTATVVLAASAWNNASASLPTYGYTGAYGAAVTGAGASSDTVALGVGGNAAAAARNKCVTAYTNRATGGGVTPIIGSGIGSVRLW